MVCPDNDNESSVTNWNIDHTQEGRSNKPVQNFLLTKLRQSLFGLLQCVIQLDLVVEEGNGGVF